MDFYHRLWHDVSSLFTIDHGGLSPMPCSHHSHNCPFVTRSTRDSLKGVVDWSRTPKLYIQPCPTRLHSVLLTTLMTINKEANITPRHPFHLQQQPLPFPRHAGILHRVHLTSPNRQNLTFGLAKCQCLSYCWRHPVQRKKSNTFYLQQLWNLSHLDII